MTEIEKAESAALTLGYSMGVIHNMRDKLKSLLPEDDEFLLDIEKSIKEINEKVYKIYYEDQR